MIGQRSFASLDHHRTGTIAEKCNPRFEILPEKQADSPFGANPHGGAFLQSVVGMRDDLFVLDQSVGGRTVKCVAILVNADGGVAFSRSTSRRPPTTELRWGRGPSAVSVRRARKRTETERPPAAFTPVALGHPAVRVRGRDFPPLSRGRFGFYFQASKDRLSRNMLHCNQEHGSEMILKCAGNGFPTALPLAILPSPLPPSAPTRCRCQSGWCRRSGGQAGPRCPFAPPQRWRRETDGRRLFRPAGGIR